MANFADCLTVIKNRRNLTVAQMAGICEIDRAIIFHWCNGSDLPKSWEQLYILINKLRLTAEEKRQLGAAFEKERIGSKQSSCFAEIKSIFQQLKQCAEWKENGNRELYQNMHMDYSMAEFRILHNRTDLLQCMQTALLGMIENKSTNLYINVQGISENLLILLEQFCRGVNQDGLEIIIGIADYSYRSEVEKLQLMHSLLELWGSNKRIIWRCRKDTVIQDGQSWILADNYCFQFSDDMECGIMTSSREWLSFFSGVGKRLAQSGELLLESRYSVKPYVQCGAEYIVGYQPEMDAVAENATVIFADKGLLGCDKKELKKILNDFTQEKRRWILLRNKDIALENICVKLFNGNNAYMEFSIYPHTKDERQGIVTDGVIVDQFQKFFEYIVGETHWAYTDEEAVCFVRNVLKME